MNAIEKKRMQLKNRKELYRVRLDMVLGLLTYLRGKSVCFRKTLTIGRLLVA